MRFDEAFKLMIEGSVVKQDKIKYRIVRYRIYLGDSEVNEYWKFQYYSSLHKDWRERETVSVSLILAEDWEISGKGDDL